MVFGAIHQNLNVAFSKPLFASFELSREVLVSFVEALVFRKELSKKESLTDPYMFVHLVL